MCGSVFSSGLNVQDVAKSMWTTDHHTCMSHFKTMSINMEFVAELLLLLYAHFTIVALTVDRADLAGPEFHKLTCGNLGHSISVRLKSLSSSVRPILLPVFFYGDCMAMCLILYTC